MTDGTPGEKIPDGAIVNPRPDWTGPQYNAWVAAGETREDRKVRLEQVPEDLRKAVEIHVKTVFTLKRWHARQAKKATPSRKC